MRFPELYAQLVQQGAQILLMPSAFTVPTGKAHWHILLRGRSCNSSNVPCVWPASVLTFQPFTYTARAIECQTFVIAAAQYGKHNEKRESYGHSLVVNPWGTILADAGGVDDDAKVGTSLVTTEIDLCLVNSIRQRMPVQQHRKAAGIVDRESK